MRSDIVPGGTFPDYALPDHTGTVRSLRELQGRDPMILTPRTQPMSMNEVEACLYEAIVTLEYVAR